VQSAPNETSEHGNGGIQGWEQALAWRVVLDYVDEHGPVVAMEAGDLVQEVLLEWVMRRQLYSHSRGASMQTFFRMVARNKLVDIYREQTAEKRGSGIAPSSLEETISQDDDDDDGAVLGDFVRDKKDMASETVGKIEHDRILELLIPRQRELALGLAQGFSLAEMARKMNVPRTTLNDELKRIQRLLRTYGYGSNRT
jgi:RNA polymerase sigma factor (sigma-70 family)